MKQGQRIRAMYCNQLITGTVTAIHSELPLDMTITLDAPICHFDRTLHTIRWGGDLGNSYLMPSADLNQGAKP
jgi:hypothetical protein